MFWNDHYYKNELFPLKEYLFEDFYVYGPKDPIPFLNLSYSNWENMAMKTYDHITDSKIKKVTFPIEYNKTTKPYLWFFIEDNISESDYQSILKKYSSSFNIIKLNDVNIMDYIPELKDINLIDYPHKTKKYLYSIMLLYKYGGIYLDCPNFVPNNLDDIMIKLRKYNFVGFGKNQYPDDNIMASRPNTILMGKTLNELLDKVKNNDINNIDNSVLIKNLQDLIKNQNFEYYHYME
jgi:mannosyltransferase OCH1-like enzyme